VIKRILLALFLGWTAIAPAIASSCAAGCGISAGAMHHDMEHAPDASDLPDCHGDANDRDGSTMPGGDSMAAACFVAAAATLPSASLSVLNLDAPSAQRSCVLLPPLSFETSAPDEPPRA
jgi:hypothetical protein